MTGLTLSVSPGLLAEAAAGELWTAVAAAL